MSADNGIYILKTPRTSSKGWEYRVEHLAAIDNVSWDDRLGQSTTNENVHIVNARQMWRGPVFKTEAAALKEATRLLRLEAICEYGISFITIRKRF